MKFKVGDKVIVTSGKYKGQKSEIKAVYPQDNKVLVKDVNLYTRHIKAMPAFNRPGEKIVRERPIDVAKIAILNDEGQPDRIGYQVNKDGSKVRIYKKTGAVIKEETVKKEEKKDK